MTVPSLPPVLLPGDDWVVARRADLVREFARQRRRRTIGLAASGAGGVIGVVAAIALSLSGLGASAAFAGWTASPTAPTEAQLRAAESACRRAPVLATAVPLLAEARGPYTLLLFVRHAVSDLCISGPSLTTTGSGGPVEHQSKPDEVTIAEVGTGFADGRPYSFVVGRSGRGVLGAQLELANGTRVQVTIERGWLAAWWPGRPDARRVVVTTSLGRRTQPLAMLEPPSARSR